MIVIGKSTLVFDITYIFGEKSTNKYITLSEAGEVELVDAAVHELTNNCGEVLICTQNEAKTEVKLREYGFRSGVDYFFFSDLKYGFINMQNGLEKDERDYLWNIYCKIFYSPHCRYEPCHRPFYEMEIAYNGDVFTCCSAIMPYSIGNMSSGTLENIWHSARAKLLRLSMLNGTAVFCSREKCFRLIECKKAELPKRVQTSDYPLIVNMAVDESCNLSCPSCRSELIIANDVSVQKKLDWIDSLEPRFYQNVRQIYVAGNGECMISRVYQEFLLHKVKERFSGNLHLVTNGQVFYVPLINEITERFRPEVLISVDAWEMNTYEKIRRGARYRSLLANLHKYLELRNKGMLSGVVVRFVIQSANYTQIPDFIAGMRKFGVDRMEFTRLVNGGAFSPELFRSNSLLDENGVLLKEYENFFAKKVKPLLADDVAMDPAFLPG